MATRIPVSVVVPVKNEAKNLARCLGPLSRFAERIVVDSGSEDGTQEIARRHGATLLQFEWNGRYPKKRNWTLANYSFSTDWVLFLDADEVVSRAFCDEVEKVVRQGVHDGYWIQYTNYFLGRRLRYGIAQRKLALFRIGKGFYERIEERGWSKLDMEVHEHPIVSGTTGELSTEVEHRDYRGLARFLDRHLDYASWEARRFLVLKRPGFEGSDQLTRRQRFKYNNIHRWWYPAFYFLFTYVVKKGFLDGSAGLYYAFYKSWYFHTVRLLISEYGAEDRGPSQSSRCLASGWGSECSKGER